MRIVSGLFKGRVLKSPAGLETRPTADKARQSLFNVLSHGKLAIDFDGIHVLDVFAGTGALGLEALSHGAAWLACLDSSPQAINCIRGNATNLGVAKKVYPLKIDATRLSVPPRIVKAPFDLVFMDAPYNQGLTEPALRALKDKAWLKDNAVIVVEVAADEAFMLPRGIHVLDERTYGAAKVQILTKR